MNDADVPDHKNWKDLEPNYAMKISLTILYSLILLTGIVGNGITIRVTQVLQQNGYLQKNVTDHMVSLACSDLLVLIIGMPVELYSATWFPFHSATGDASCKIYNFLFETCSYATILNVATLSFERYMAICHPFRFKALGKEHTACLIALAWVTAVIVALPLLFATGMEGHVPERARGPVQNLTFCTNLKEQWTMYRASIFGAFILYMVVLISVGVMCWAMILVLKQTMGPTEGGINNVESTPRHESARVKAAKKQTIIFLGLIVGSLILFWMPNQVRRLMTAAVPKSNWTMPYFRGYVLLHPIADTFFYLSSVLNPFLYNLSSKNFREVFVQVMCCRLTLEHKNKQTITNANSARSLRPLLSLRRDKRSTQNKELKVPKFSADHSLTDTTTTETEALHFKTNEFHSVAVRNINEPAETEI
ncbi:hypothetical protein UPYG_G00317650 [Umbra pygmaea]|uniref:G-protein coupled receptors family 1 profile domain-containing protein n=1 Tax=Umbra pygmaea TaxID=75934 RepID=A0ABD0W1U7_UMBPY